MPKFITDLQEIEKKSIEKEWENDQFRVFIEKSDNQYIDSTVTGLNAEISSQIDCTQCGRCCKVLMIHVTEEETERLSGLLNLTPEKVKEKYIETSEQGQMIMNSIPCAFLDDKKCSVYENRFTECREFPHLHKGNFKKRMFSTMMYYAMCPIIYNVVEELKLKTNFLRQA